MKYTKENIVEGINAKLDRLVAMDPDFEDLRDMYSCSMRNYPIEVEQNVLEWVNDEALTDIDCHGASMKQIMDDFHLPDWYFPTLLDNFILYKKNGFRGGTYICYEGLL